MTHARHLLIVLTLLTGIAGPAIAVAEDREAKQAELDAACEAARQEKLAPLKAKYIEECVAKEQRPDRAACERFYADFGARSGNQPPLFYDLPECVVAHEYRLGKR